MTSLADLSALPPTLNGHQAADIWGISYWSLLERNKAGALPVKPLLFGRSLRWPTQPVLRSIGFEPPGENDEGGPGGPTYAITVPALIATTQEGQPDGT